MTSQKTGLILCVAGTIVGGIFIAGDLLAIPGLADGRLGVGQLAGAAAGGLLTVIGIYGMLPGKRRKPEEGIPQSRRIDPTNLILLLGSLLVTFVLMEVMAQVYLKNFASDQQFNRYASLLQLQRRYGENFASDIGVSRFIGHRYLGYIPNPGWSTAQDQHNSRGFRGVEIVIPKPDGVYRIVCLGGSTTYGGGVVNYQLAYPYLLQEYLQDQGYEAVEVVNAGAFAWTSYESLINFELRVLDFEPDMIIVYHGINDLAPRWSLDPESYRNDGRGRQTPLNRSREMIPLWQYSTALRTIAVMIGYIEPAGSLDYLLGVGINPDLGAFDLLENQLRFGQGREEHDPNVDQAQTPVERLAANPPIYFERNLYSMIALADAYDVTVMLSTIALTPEFDDNFATEAYAVGIAEHNDLIRRVATDSGVYLYDFGHEMPTDIEYFTDGIHFSHLGNELRAQLVGDFMIEASIFEQK